MKTICILISYIFMYLSIMKHLLSFAVALCSIVLIALISTPGYAGSDVGIKQKTVLDIGFADINTPVVLGANFGAANLPERISIPEPDWVDYVSSKNDPDRKKENRKLKESNYIDADPHLNKSSK